MEVEAKLHGLYDLFFTEKDYTDLVDKFKKDVNDVLFAASESLKVLKADVYEKSTVLAERLESVIPEGVSVSQPLQLSYFVASTDALDSYNTEDYLPEARVDENFSYSLSIEKSNITAEEAFNKLSEAIDALEEKCH